MIPKFTGSQAEPAQPENEATAMPRPPYDPPEYSEGTILVAVDAETSPALDPLAIEVYLGVLLSEELRGGVDRSDDGRTCPG